MVHDYIQHEQYRYCTLRRLLVVIEVMNNYRSNEKPEFSIEVENDGYIIPQEMREKIFEPFFRMKETKHQTGNGIGLALSRSLAELHKGKLNMKKSDASMNIFVLTLPVHSEN